MTKALIFQRAFTATLGHAAFTGSMGFFWGLAKFGERRWMPLWMAVGLGSAVLFHGLYDLFLLREGPLAMLSLLFVLPLGLLLLGLKIRWSRAQSPLYHPRLATKSGSQSDC